MKLFLYYALHSAWGVIRKLFRTWVAIFFAACIVIGILFGIGAATLEDAMEETPTTWEEPAEDMPEEEIPFSALEAMPAGEAFLTLGVLALFSLSLFTGEKSGSQIFTMADVNFLFPSPRKPQSVLLFRMTTQMGAFLAASLYFVFQIPNLIWNLSVPPVVAWSLIAVLFFALIFHQLLGMLTFSLAASFPRLRGKVRPLLYLLLFILGAGFLLFTRVKGASLWQGALAFLSAPWTRWIPIVGWIKAIPFLLYEGAYLPLALCLVALILAAVLLIRVIWSLKVDFYEDALAKASEMAEIMRQAEESQKGAVTRRKKDRSDHLRRDLSLKGTGAQVLFFKALCNRFRLATWRVFTKTSTTYLVIGLAVPLLARFLAHSSSSLFLALPFSLVVFFRAFGNPILEDVSKPFFNMIPQSALSKVAYSSLGGCVNTLLDLVPGWLLGSLLLGAPLYKMIIWLLFLASLDFFAAAFGMFTDLSLPEAIPKNIKSGIQVLLIYSSAVPALVCIGIGAALGHPFPFVLLASGIQAVIGTVLTCLSPLFLIHGRK